MITTKLDAVCYQVEVRDNAYRLLVFQDSFELYQIVSSDDDDNGDLILLANGSAIIPEKEVGRFVADSVYPDHPVDAEEAKSYFGY